MSKVLLMNTILSYPHLFKARAVKQGDIPKFSGNFILPPDYDWTQLQAAYNAVLAEQFPGQQPPEHKAPWTQVKDGPYAGWWQVAARSESQPGIVDQNKQPLINPSQIFAGCIVHAHVGLFWYDNMGNRGVAAGLNHVMLVQNEGVQRLDGGTSVEEAFRDIPGAPAPTAPVPGAGPAPAGPGPTGLAPAAAPAGYPAPQPGMAPAAPVTPAAPAMQPAPNVPAPQVGQPAAPGMPQTAPANPWDS